MKTYSRLPQGEKNRDSVQSNSAQNWQKVKETVPCKVSSTSTAGIRKAYGMTQEHCSSTKSSTAGCHSAGTLNKNPLSPP